MKIRPYDFVKLLYHVVLGAALLLLSAVVENGETEMSRTLVARTSDVPEMIEALIAGMAFAVACGCGVCYIQTVSEKRG